MRHAQQPEANRAALQAYHQANGCFPPAYIADKNGKPMHSWRVLILPYLDYDDLYKAYDFSEPWDGPKNKTAAGHAASWSMPARATSPRAGRRCPDKLCRRGGAERRLGGREVEKTCPADFPGKDLQHDHARRGGRLGHRLDGTAGLVAGRRSEWPRQAARAGAVEQTWPTRRVLLHLRRRCGVNVAMADGSVQLPVDRLVVRPRTCGRSCKSVATRKRKSALCRLLRRGTAT